MNSRQIKLLEFVRQAHEGQVRNYTGEPYFNHVLNVAMASKFLALGFEIGLCHDLLEDTKTTEHQLRAILYSFYTMSETEFIVRGVIELTDVYTKESYPELNRKQRKELEFKRLSEVHPIVQSVKYCDLIDNMASIKYHDPKFYKVYVKEKKELISVMKEGNKELLEICKWLVNDENKI